jgi:hypothetical protein
VSLRTRQFSNRVASNARHKTEHDVHVVLIQFYFPASSLLLSGPDHGAGLCDRGVRARRVCGDGVLFATGFAKLWSSYKIQASYLVLFFVGINFIELKYILKTKSASQASSG